MAPAYGGAYTALALPATASRQLLVPAALALAIEATRRPTPAVLASAAAASFVVAVVHPTYALFLVVPVHRASSPYGSSGCVATPCRTASRSGPTLPMAAFFAWLLPVIGDTASVSPDERERLRGFEQYDGQLEGTPDLFSVVPELFGRSGAIAVAALLLLPLAALAARRRWAAYAVGGALAVFAITLLPWIFTPFSDAVSLSQSRRLAGFLPLRDRARGRDRRARPADRTAGRAGRARGWSGAATPLSGDFGYFLEDGGPAWATWFAVVGCVVALFVGLRGRPPLERRAALATVLLLPRRSSTGSPTGPRLRHDRPSSSRTG